MARIPVNQPYQISTQFGVPDSNARFGRHSGIDYEGFRAGRPVYAPTSGELRNVVSPTGGNMVQIFDGKYYHRLMHNSSFSRSDGRVTDGDEVAKAGTTGLSTGVHCHWDIATQQNPSSFSAFIDPNVWLNSEGEEMQYVTKELMDTVWPNMTYDGNRPTEADYDAWLGKDRKSPKDLHTFIVYKINEELKGHAITNRGDVFNVLKPLLGHDPTPEDYQNWSGVSHKKFEEKKIIPEINNRIKR